MTEGAHILLVDDDPLIRRLFGGKLAELGYNIIYATNGNEGRETARRLKPDLILMDVNMPGYENGLETAVRLKEEAETKDIPIVLLTNADLSIEAESRFKELMTFEYIHKSTPWEEIVEKIKLALKQG